jgi:hypothetical protein
VFTDADGDGGAITVGVIVELATWLIESFTWYVTDGAVPV